MENLFLAVVAICLLPHSLHGKYFDELMHETETRVKHEAET